MSRIHIGLNVDDLEASVRFYSALFGQEPNLRADDYAKWMVEDPRVNFSITARESVADKVHFGIQVESRAELDEAAARLRRAGETVRDEETTTCCYHRSDKAWAADPERFLWETFVTHGTAADYGEDSPGLKELQCCR